MISVLYSKRDYLQATAVRTQALSWLHDASYLCLMALCPQLPRLSVRPAALVARHDSLPALELRICAGARFTADLQLTPLDGEAGPQLEMRVYHDSRQAEPLHLAVPPRLDDRDRRLDRCLEGNRRLFVGLRRCLGAGYHFAPNARSRP